MCIGTFTCICAGTRRYDCNMSTGVNVTVHVRFNVNVSVYAHVHVYVHAEVYVFMHTCAQLQAAPKRYVYRRTNPRRAVA